MKARSRLPEQLWRVLPVLFASFPIASHLASNIGEVEPAEALRPLLLSIAFAYLILGILWLASGRDGDRAALATVGILMVFFAYGHVRLLTKDLTVAGVLVGRHRHLAIALGGPLIVWLWLCLRGLRHPSRMTPVVAAVGLLALISPMLTIGAGLAAELLPVPGAQPVAGVALEPGLPGGESQPDVYLIVLDGYARADVLQEIYGYDNSEFLDALRARGFYVADRAHSNYNRTLLSLAAILNFEYVQDILGRDLTATDNDVVQQLATHSRVRQGFESLGYTTVTFDTGFERTRMPDAARYVEFPQEVNSLQSGRLPVSLSPFEGSLIGTTALMVLEETIPALSLHDTYQVDNANHRTRVRSVLGNLELVPQWEGEHLVIAHVISPHPPFVFAADGAPIHPNRPFAWSDADHFRAFGTRKEYIEGYRGQIAYLNKLVLDAVDGILQNSPDPPIIVIQGDHGPGAYTTHASVDKTNLAERLSILNAYYLPHGGERDLYPSITPVNSFRVILNRYFGAELPLLPDRSYYAEGATHKLVPVTWPE